MLFGLILILVANLVRCEFEVGMQYDYFYKTDSKLVTTESDDQDMAEQPLIFSCLATIICTSANANGHEFLLKLTGIHLTLKDGNNGKMLTDYANLQVDRDYSKPFTFTILSSGAVADVKAAKDEPEEVLTIKTGIVGMFISVSENEIHSPVETIDNQGIYMSHWQNKTSDNADTVELSRHFTDEDFIHFRDDNVDEHTFILHVMEKRKIKAGIVSEVTSENTLLLSGKQFLNEKKKVLRRYKNRQRMYNGVKVESNEADLGDDDEMEYDGTEIVQHAATSLKHLSTKVFPKRSSLSSLGESNGDDKSEKPDDSQLKHVAHFSRDFYSARAETQKLRGEPIFKVSFIKADRAKRLKPSSPSSPESHVSPNITYHQRAPSTIYDAQSIHHLRHKDRIRTKVKEWDVRKTEGKGPRGDNAHLLGFDWGFEIKSKQDKLLVPCSDAAGGIKDLEHIGQAVKDCPDDDDGPWKHENKIWPSPKESKESEAKKKEKEKEKAKAEGKDTEEKDENGNAKEDDDDDDDDDDDEDDKGPARFCVKDDDFFEDFKGKKKADKKFEDAQNDMKTKVNNQNKSKSKSTKGPGKRSLAATQSSPSMRHPQSPSMFEPSKFKMEGDRVNRVDVGERDCEDGLENCVHYGAGYFSDNDNTGFFTDASFYAGVAAECLPFNCNFKIGAYAYAKFKIIGKEINIIDIYAEYGFVDNKPARNGVSCQFFIFDPFACRFKDPACRREEVPVKFKKEPKKSLEKYFMFLVCGIVPLQFGLGVGVTFGVAFFLDMCLYNGSIAVGLEPSLTIKAFISVAVGFGFWKFRIEAGIRITAEITVSFVPSVGLSLAALQLYIKAVIEISPIRAALELYFNIMGWEGKLVLWQYSFGGWEITLFEIPFSFSPVTAEHFRIGMETMAAYNLADTGKTGSAHTAKEI